MVSILQLVACSVLALQAPATRAAADEVVTPEKRGDIFMARKMYREAVEEYQKVTPASAISLNKIGIAYHQMMNLASARKYYERSLKANPKYAEALNNLGTVNYGQKKFRRAVGYYNRALKLAPKSASIYSNLGTVQFARGKYDEATRAYETAMQLDPDIFDHHSSYGTMLQERSVQEKAKYHFYLARTFAKNGRNDRALQYLRMAFEEGFKERDKVMESPEFAGLLELPEFKELMASTPKVL
jgi:tetratricopeptide (TPR) repeat protein